MSPEQPGVHLARGSAATAAGLFVSALGVLFPFFIARLLGQSALGAYAVAWGTADLLSKLTVFGLDQTTVALAARLQAAGDVPGVRRLHSDALRLGAAATAIVGLLALAAFRFLGPRLGLAPELVRAEQLVLLTLPGVTLYRISNGLSRGLGFMRHDAASGGLVENATTVLALLGLVALGQGDRAPILAAACGFTAGGLTALVLARRALALAHGAGVPAPVPPVEALATPSPEPERHLALHSAPVAVYALLNLLVNKADVLLLGTFVGRVPGVTAATLGIYAAASEIAGVTRKARSVIEPALTVEVAARGDEAVATLGRAGRWTLTLLLPMVGLLAVAGPLVLRLFGRGFAEGAAWLAVLGAAHGLGAFAGMGETVLLVRRPSWNVLNSALAVVTQLGVGWLLVPRLGPLGAALGTLGAATVLTVLRVTELARLGIRWPWRPLGRPLTAFAVAMACGVAARPLGDAAAAGALLGSYVAGWTVLGLGADDLAVLRALRRAGR